MNPLEMKVKELEKKVADLEALIAKRGNMVVIRGRLQVDGDLYGDKIYTQRSDNYVELTT